MTIQSTVQEDHEAQLKKVQQHVTDPCSSPLAPNALNVFPSVVRYCLDYSFIAFKLDSRWRQEMRMDIKCRPPRRDCYLTVIRITIRILRHLKSNSQSRSFPSTYIGTPFFHATMRWPLNSSVLFPGSLLDCTSSEREKETLLPSLIILLLQHGTLIIVFIIALSS